MVSAKAQSWEFSKHRCEVEFRPMWDSHPGFCSVGDRFAFCKAQFRLATVGPAPSSPLLLPSIACPWSSVGEDLAPGGREDREVDGET